MSFLLCSSLLGERIYQQAIAKLIGDPIDLRHNVITREDTKVWLFSNVNAKTVLSP